MTLEEYIERNGYEVSDFTEDELKEIGEELEMVNRGEEFLDGFFSCFIRKRKGTD